MSSSYYSLSRCIGSCAIPLNMVNFESLLIPNLCDIQGKKWVKLKCRPLTPLGMPVLPEVKDRVAGESGPRTTPAGDRLYCWYGSRMSGPDSALDPVIPFGVIAIAGMRTRRESSFSMYSDTVGDRLPAEEMMRRARGVETDR